MPNPYGALAGWSDPEDPDWEDNLAKMLSPDKPRRRDLRRPNKGFEADQAFWDLAMRMARKRGITRAAYLRRAVAAFLAHDSGQDFADLTRMLPTATPYGTQGAHAIHRTRTNFDDGEGYGPWHIEGLS